MKLYMTTVVTLLYMLSASAQEKKPVTTGKLSDVQKIEVLKLQRNYADLRGQIAQAQVQLQQMQAQIQAQYEAMQKACGPEEQVDLDTLDCKSSKSSLSQQPSAPSSGSARAPAK